MTVEIVTAGNKLTDKKRHEKSAATPKDTLDLIDRAREDDAGAFRDLVRKYSPGVNRLAYRICSNSEDARDIAQEVFIRLYRSLDNFDERRSFGAWLYRITINMSLDHARKSKRHKAISLDKTRILSLSGQENSGPDREAETEELKEVIIRISECLSRNQRRVFVLRDMEGFSVNEIAAIVKLRTSTVRVHLARARHRVKSLLEEHHADLMEVYKSEMRKG